MLKTTDRSKPLTGPLKQSSRLMHAFTYEICVYPSPAININTFPPAPMPKQRTWVREGRSRFKQTSADVLMDSWKSSLSRSPSPSSSISSPINHLLVRAIELRSCTSFGCKKRTNVCLKSRLCLDVNELSKNIERYVFEEVPLLFDYCPIS